MKPTKPKARHIGAGKAPVNLYWDEELYGKLKLRAESLGLSVSKHLAELAKKDLVAGGPVTIEPVNSPRTESPPGRVGEEESKIVDRLEEDIRRKRGGQPQ